MPADVAKAIVTFCYEDEAGNRPLPWCFVQFGGTGEERKYVAPVRGLGVVDLGAAPYKVLSEYMPNRAFPLESARPARVNSSEDNNVRGPFAVHFFSTI